MSKVILVALIALPLATAAALQERVKPKGPPEFATCLRAAEAAWKAQQYGECTNQLQDALTAVSVKRAEVLRAALPPAPEGYTIEVDRSMEQLRNNPMAAGLAASLGNVVKQSYRGPDGRFEVTVSADSPLVQMMNMMISNPAMLGDKGELIKYGAHNAVLKNEGSNRINLQILIAGKHVCEVSTRDLREEFVFKIFDQAAVDKLAAALGR